MASRALQRGRLWTRDLGKARKRRAQQFQQAAEGDLGFGLDPSGPQNPH